MASTTVVKVKVEELTKYGFKMNGKYVNYSKQFTDQARVVPGAEFEAEFYIADSGKEYLNKILAIVPVAPSVKRVVTGSTTPNTVISNNLPLDAERAKHFTPKFKAKDDTSMSKAEWQAKDRSQMIGGLSHDAAAIVASLINVIGDLATTEAALVAYKKVLEGMLKIRTEVQ